jgi:hypothetical protein
VGPREACSHERLAVQPKSALPLARAGGTFALLRSFLSAKAGIATTFVDVTDLAAVEAALRAHPLGKVKARHSARRAIPQRALPRHVLS